MFLATRNRLGNVRNPYQGDFKKVLCVCSAGLLRSPTLAWVLSQDPYNHNTRAVGYNTEYALIPVDQALVNWADQIVFVESQAKIEFERLLLPHFSQSDWDRFSRKELITLDIPDIYEFRDPKLVETIKRQYKAAVGF